MKVVVVLDVVGVIKEKLSTLSRYLYVRLIEVFMLESRANPRI